MKWLMVVYVLLFNGDVQQIDKEYVQTPTKDITECQNIGNKIAIDFLKKAKKEADETQTDMLVADGFTFCAPQD